MFIGYENGCKLLNTTRALVNLQVAKDNTAMLPVLLASR